MPKNYKLLSREVYQRVTVRSRGYLPHWEVDNSHYFITYRLADSLPRHVVLGLLEERKRLAMSLGNETAVQRAEIDRRFGERLDFYLDQGFGSCHLQKPEIASCVVDNLRYFHGGRYELISWCVMPNHVHVIIFLRKGKDLAGITHSWKSYTALVANQVVGRTGRFWHPEYFDRALRDDEELARTTKYVLENPAKAGLREWRWVGSME